MHSRSTHNPTRFAVDHVDAGIVVGIVSIIPSSVLVGLIQLS